MMAVMGLILRDLHRLEDAQRYLKESLDIQEKIFSQESLLKAETLCNLGTVLHRMEDRQGSFENLDAAFAMIKGVKYEHPITATISAARARLYLNMGDLNSAQASLQEAVAIRTRCTGDMHPNVALYHDFMAQIMLMNDETTNAQVYMAKAHEAYRFLYAREARLSQQAGLELPILDTWARVMQQQRLQVNQELLSE